MRKEVELSRGTLAVTVKKHHPDWQLPHLLDFAERINPKRAFLFVSKVLGKHIPVKPSTMQQSYVDLCRLIPHDLPTPMTVVGMAETAVCLGAGVYRELKKNYAEDAVFVTTTRHPAPHLPLLGDFLEEHSHAQDQMIYGSNDPKIHAQILASQTLILVDDEISTGKTFKNLIRSFKQAELNHIQRIILVSLVDWNEGNLEKTYLDIPMESLSLIYGNWEWTAKPDAPIQAMPNVSSTAQGLHDILAPTTWGREPSYLNIQPFAHTVHIQPHEKVLILGSGEFAWLPFLFAEQLEQQGIEVYFSSTTRSPIMSGHAIQSICHFQDNYGLGMNNYAYNVLDKNFDRIFLIIETSKDSVDPALFQQIKHLEVLSYDA